MKCIFCEIVDAKAPAVVLYENDSVMAFLDINPMNFGHTLVIPKKHYHDFSTIPAKETADLIHAMQIVSKAVRDGVKADGYNIISNNGTAAGQSVSHFHFHIIPRFSSDFHMKVNLKKYTGSSIYEYAEKIKKEINPLRRDNE
jgi:histidine triad (HIT) family protein